MGVQGWLERSRELYFSVWNKEGISSFGREGGAWVSVVVKALRYYSDGPGIGGFTWDFFRGSFRQNHVL